MKYYHNLQRTYEFEYSEHEFPIVYGDDIKPKNPIVTGKQIGRAHV